ncbi:MAG TPA: hypothetical protein VJL34_12335 [Anaerolineales bacterium]|nr:hypothetical protein [Anaerolineales bacterium]
MERHRQEHHNMVLVNSYPSGEEELYCPTCGRRILIRWPCSKSQTDYKKVVLQVGDEYAIHHGWKGSLKLDASPVTRQAELSAQNPSARQSAHDDQRLAQWEQWLEQMGFEGWWAGEI